MTQTILLGINHPHKKLSIREQINALPDNSFFVIVPPDFKSCGGDIFWKLAEAGVVVHVPSGKQSSAFALEQGAGKVCEVRRVSLKVEADFL